MSFYFDPHAIRELQQATDYYSSISHTPGEAFAYEMDRVIKRILSLPRAWTIITASIRRAAREAFLMQSFIELKMNKLKV